MVRMVAVSMCRPNPMNTGAQEAFLRELSDVNAYVQNGYIRANLFSQSDNYNALSGGNIDSAARSYGWIGLNSYAYSGASSNKNAEFWNGHANSGVTAGTDGLSAWTAWEAPVDFLPSV